MLGSGGQCHQCYQPGIRRIESESAFLVRAVKSRPQGQSDARPMKGIGLVSNGAVQRSDEQAKADTDLIHQVSRERAKALLAAFLCHDAMMPLKRRTDSAPAPPGASVAFLRLSGLEREYGFRWASQSSIQSADISELSDGVLCPFQADSHRRHGAGFVPTAACDGIKPSQDSSTGDPAAQDGSPDRWKQGRREPTRICDCSAARSQIPYYNRPALGFSEIDFVGVCPIGYRCAVTWDFAA